MRTLDAIKNAKPIIAKWAGDCPSCRWRHEFVSATEIKNPYPVGLVCNHCRIDVVFLDRTPG